MAKPLIISSLLPEFEAAIVGSPLVMLDEIANESLPVDYFEFYKAVSSVYSSKIEGEDIDFDSFFKHKFLKIEYQPDYTSRADDLYAAYQFTEHNTLNLQNVKHAHSLLSANLLPQSQRGQIRANPMFVVSSDDRIEYVATAPSIVVRETEQFFEEVEALVEKELSANEVFYYAALIHLVFVKIHPFNDGNGRTARLMEKWFLTTHLGKKAIGVNLEKNYFTNRDTYYANIRKLGVEYEQLDYSKSLDFLLMTVQSLQS